MIAKKVSRIGTPKIKMGIARVKVAALLTAPCTDMVASIPPKNSAPLSPRKIFAGGKL
jgi:hypothetical protein